MRLIYHEDDTEDSGSVVGLPDQNEAADIIASLSGVYLDTIVPMAEQSDAGASPTANLQSGVYFDTIVEESQSETGASPTANLQSGVYFLAAVSETQSESGSVTANLQSGVYFLQAISAPDQSESGSVTANMTGAYA